MTRAELLTRLDAFPACAESRVWATGTPGTPEELWSTCPRGDWLLWFAARAGVDRRVVVLVACDCAEMATPHLADSTRGLALTALETARRWARGEATEAEVNHASHAAAYAAILCTAMDHAAYAAAEAARATSACDAAYAAYAAYAAERAAAATRDWVASLQRSADLVRARIPWATVEAALLGGAS